MAADGKRRPRVNVVRLPHAEGMSLPAYQSDDAAGLDLAAAVPEGSPLTLAPGARVLVPTGLALELPRGFEAQVRPRSGLAVRHGITVLNSPGTIHADYRGEVQVILVNLGDVAFKISRGERIAQLVVAPVVQIALSERKSLRATARGAGGFGSTGMQASKRGRTSAKKAKPTLRRGTAAKKTSAKRR